jgi:hypothetical protein
MKTAIKNAGKTCKDKANVAKRYKSILCILICTIMSLTSCSGQSKTREKQKAILTQMAKKEAAQYKNYAEKPMYYLQINKSACRLIVKVNDIPLGYYFTEDAGESMLYPVNDCIFSSGKQTFTIDVYPMSTKEYLTKDAHVNVKLVYLPDKSLPLVPHGKSLKELNLPMDIESRELKFYTDSSAFEANVPYDYSYILAQATNLTNILDLERKVVRRFNEIRQYYVNFDAVGYEKDRYLTFPTGDMSYLTEEELIEINLNSWEEDFNPDVVDRKVLEIENYEMVICGYGKFVLLRNKKELTNVLKITYFESEEKKAKNPENYWILDYFAVLYLPKGSDRLEMFY